MRTFTVEKGVMGYIVTIGCQKAGFSNREELIAAIAEYITDPVKTKNKYRRDNLSELNMSQEDVDRIHRETKEPMVTTNYALRA